MINESTYKDIQISLSELRIKLDHLKREYYHLSLKANLYNELCSGIIKVVYDVWSKNTGLLIELTYIGDSSMKLENYSVKVVKIDDHVESNVCFDLGNTLFLNEFFTTENKLGLKLSSLC